MEVGVEERGASLRSFYRLTGAAGLAGGVLAIVANALHPRQSPANLGNVENFLEIIDGFALWRVDHLLIIVSVLLSMFGLIGIARVLTDEGASPWANLCLPVGVLTGAVAAVSFAIDGFVMGGAAEHWAETHISRGIPEVDSILALEAIHRAETLSLIDGAVFAVAVMGLFGAAQLVYALALLKSDAFPRWTGIVGVVGGVAGLLSGSLMWMKGGFDVFNFLVLFTLTSVLFTAWVIGCSLVLYKRGAPEGA